MLLFLEKEPFGKKDLAKKLKHKSISGELKKRIKNLLNDDLIEMTIPEKPNSRLQKYRITDKGEKLLKELK